MSQLILDPIAQADSLVESLGVYLIGAPATTVTQLGLPVMGATYNMVVDIAAETTEVSVWDFHHEVLSESVPVAGDELSEAIIQYIKSDYDLVIGERTAEEIKIQIGSAYPTHDDETMEIRGLHLLSGLPRTITIRGGEIRESISKPLSKIVEIVKFTLNKTPPKLEIEIGDWGIGLTGSGSFLKGLDILISNETGIKTCRIANSSNSRIFGTRLLENLAQLDQTIRLGGAFSSKFQTLLKDTIWSSSDCSKAFEVFQPNSSLIKALALEAFQPSPALRALALEAFQPSSILKTLEAFQPNPALRTLALRLQQPNSSLIKALALEAFQPSPALRALALEAFQPSSILKTLEAFQPNPALRALALRLQQPNSSLIKALALEAFQSSSILKTLEAFDPSSTTREAPSLGASFSVSKSIAHEQIEEQSLGKEQEGEPLSREAQHQSNYPSVKVKRHTCIDFPPECIQEEKVELQVRVVQDIPEVIRAALKEAIAANTTRLINLDVYVTAPGFSVDPWHQKLILPVIEDSEDITFTLLPLDLGEQVIEIEIFRKPWRVAYVLVKTNVLVKDNTEDRMICLKP